MKGDSTTTSLGRKGLIEVLAYRHNVVVNRDPQPGTAIGPPPAPFWKKSDLMSSAPDVNSKRRCIFPGLLTNDTIVKAVFRFFQSRPRWQGAGVYRVTLEDGRIDCMSTRLPHAKATDSPNQDKYRELAFSYRKITVENLIVE